MGSKGYSIVLKENPTDLAQIPELNRTNHYLALLITSARRTPDGVRESRFGIKEVRCLSQICIALGYDKAVSSWKHFDNVDVFWEMIETARRGLKELSWTGFQRALYAVCYFYNRLRLTYVFSKDFRENEHSPYSVLGKKSLLVLLTKPETNKETFFSFYNRSNGRRIICILDFQSCYLRTRLIKTLCRHRICEDNSKISVTIIKEIETWFEDPLKIAGYRDFTPERLYHACNYINNHWTDNYTARKYRYKLLFNMWRDIILDYPQYNFFEDSYLFNTEMILNGLTPIHLANGYHIVNVDYAEEIEPYELILFVVFNNEKKTSSGHHYYQRCFDASMISDRKWRKALVNYAAHCLNNGNHSYNQVVHTLCYLIQLKSTGQDKYTITREDIYRICHHIRGKNIRSSSQSTTFFAFKSFVLYARSYGIIVKNDVFKYNRVIFCNNEPNARSLSKAEINAIINALESLSQRGLHYKYSSIIFQLQLINVARIGEICSILCKDIVFKSDGTCTVHERVKNNGKDMMDREYDKESTKLIREAMTLSKPIRNNCPIGGPKDSLFLYENGMNCPSPYSSMNVNRYNLDLKEACIKAGTQHFNSGNVRDTSITSRNKFAQKEGMNELETNAFVGHLKKESTNSYIDLDFLEFLRNSRNINIK